MRVIFQRSPACVSPTRGVKGCWKFPRELGKIVFVSPFLIGKSLVVSLRYLLCCCVTSQLCEFETINRIFSVMNKNLALRFSVGDFSIEMWIIMEVGQRDD
jgi:hypothetical protein